MRRVFAISLAILVVMLATRGVVAQDSQQDGNDLLLKILKEKNIITDEQLQEIQGQLDQQQNVTEQKLTALDRSLADYLAKRGDSFSGNTTYIQNQGVTYASGDGNWSVFFGGLFQAGYFYSEGDTEDPHGGFAARNRFDFGGQIFDPNLSFYTQFEAWSDEMDVYMIDAYAEWAFCESTAVRLGKFKVPYGRQSLVDASDRAFAGALSLPYYGRGSVEGFRLGSMGRDTGLMFHSQPGMNSDPNGLAFEWAAGIWNGSGDNFSNDTWLMWGVRAGVYPWGMVDYVEGDWAMSPDVKAGIAGSFFMDETHSTSGGDNPQTTSWEIDAVVTWNGLFFTGEYFSRDFDNGSTEITDTGWYAQGGYRFMPEFELLASYGMITQDNDDVHSEWRIGGAWYFDGHEWKVVAAVGQLSFEPDSGGDDIDDWFIELVFQADW